MNASSSEHSRAERVAGWVLHALAWLSAVALLGIVGALLMGSFPHHLRRAGWLAGAAFAAVAYPVGWIKRPFKKTRDGAESQPRTARKHSIARRGQPVGPLRSCATLAFWSGVLGFFVGLEVVIFWISLALSPLTPESWREGMETGFLAMSFPGTMVFTLLGITMLLFILLGAVLGLAGDWRSVKHNWTCVGWRHRT